MRALLLLLTVILLPFASHSANAIAEKPNPHSARMRLISYKIDHLNPEKVVLGISTPNGRAVFVSVGQLIPGTKLRVQRFDRKRTLDPNGKVLDHSEAVLVHTETNATSTISLGSGDPNSAPPK